MAFDPDAFLEEDFDPDIFLGAQPQEPTATDYGQALVSGANVLAPSLAGMPVDFARNVANLGIAAYGAGRKEM